MADFVEGNQFDKYGSTNPVHRWLMAQFLTCARTLVSQAAPESVLEVGCGAGELANELFQPGTQNENPVYTGLDLSVREVLKAAANFPMFQFLVADAEKLPVATRSFDLVVACEVLEHVEKPEIAIAELARVSRGYVLLSVPWEPIWRILNCARGKYVGQLGNTPGHINHFSRRAIRKIAGTHFQIERELSPFPWTMMLLSHRKQS